jgi:hypothetical protein
MGSFSNYLETALLKHAFNVSTYTRDQVIYIALTKSTIADTHTGTTIPTELTGGSYARKKASTWTVSGGTASNNAPVQFAQATADWGVATDFAVVTHSSTGQILAYGKLNTTKNIQSGDTAKFATGDIDITLD